ncbi:FliH/SctL family protein [Nitrosovibrio sp. Nv17]|uniref:FliH/SctL family protein n=1 Tax=Nitrosovibrio sp. Nv17 TaxID=1855339 RepID=UPI0009088094|nr:FliH/SctL family protein [Nitrosovibrio sp. Nv17]SFW14477.1 flagellar assembly protein FliH [Nitrosovibrio sp. Nv17]
MSSRIIPKERLPACQPWAMDAFAPPARAAEPGGESVQCDSDLDAISPSTAGQIRHIHQQAQQAGYEAGYEAGRRAGHEAALQARNVQTALEVEKLREILHGLQKEMAAADQAIATDLLALALDLAREMVREALAVKPELMLAVVRECIRHDSLFGHPAQLHLHPNDVSLVKEHLDHELGDCAIHADARLERGGCRLQVGDSRIDATLATRWQRIAQALGRSDAWLQSA